MELTDTSPFDGEGRAGARRVFSELNLPSFLTVGILTDIVAAQRGKPIIIKEHRALSGTGLCGLWVSTEDRELLFHAPAASALHGRQFILHELSHMILRHDENPDSPDTDVPLFSDLEEVIVRRALGRTSFCSNQETAAEHLADLLAGALRRSKGKDRGYGRFL